MNKRGMVALEALIASGQVLLLAAAVSGLLVIFWQSWLKSTQASLQRQWSTVAFAYLDADLRNAEKVTVTFSEIRVIQEGKEYVYQVTADKSFYRGEGSAFYPLAKVDSVRWWQEGNLLWIEIYYPEESYRCCYCLEGVQ
ncbi:MAG TPA: hypothetical protein DG577_03715 [Firmicutes bacterium]|jgi:hypothetical protein|nr:hypothetical protein [Bacillota bacterium]HCX78502.1 hypothetical protein [Bacillota bacterium]